MAVSKDGQTIATGSSDKTVRTWNAVDGKPKLVYTLSAGVSSLAFSADGKTLAAGLADGSARVFDMANSDPAKAEHLTIPGNGGPVFGLAVLPDGNTVVTGSDDKQVRLWPIAPAVSKELKGHSSQVYCVAWSADGKGAITGGGDAAVRIWDVAKGSQVKAMEKAHANSVYAVLVHPKGDLLITSGDDKLIKYWNPADGKEVRKGEGHRRRGLLPGLPPRSRDDRQRLGGQDCPALERGRRQGDPHDVGPSRRRLRRRLHPGRQAAGLARLRRESVRLGGRHRQADLPPEARDQTR